MRLSNDKVRIIPYEPNIHAGLLYSWFHSGDYGMLFDNLNLFSMADCVSLKNAFAVVNPRDPSDVYGFFSLTNIDERNRRLQINGMVDRKYQGNGVGPSAMKFIIYHVMNQMNFYKVIGMIREGNDFSERMVKELGFETEGILKSHVYVDGEFHNVIQAYITKGMFNKRYKQALEAEVRGDQL